MDFKTLITIFKKTYEMLKKFKLENYLPLDSLFLDKCPEIVSQLQTYSNIAKIALFATNGKKTTLSLLNQILKTNNNSFITNLSDKPELCSPLMALILNLNDNLEKKDYYTFAFLEDELLKNFDYTKFDYLLLNNLFNSQTDFSTLKEKRAKIQQALNLNPKTKLIINADELMFYDFENIINKFYFGFTKVEFSQNIDLSQKNDILFCPKCDKKLEFKERFYSHLGDYSCNCSFKRPKLDLSANAKIYNDCSYLTVFYKENKFVFKVPLGGLYNAYNALGAISLALNLNIERKIITNALENYSPIKLRDEIIEYKNKKIKLKVIKNPVSLTESIRELYKNTTTKVVFCLNDEKIDGIDTSWIFDSNFEALKDFQNKIYISSNRCDDMALKLKYCGVSPSFMVVDSSIKSAINCCYWDLEEGENMLIFLTPSLENKVLKILNK